ncbi:sugar kinase [Streptomyces sp. TRM66268-LWL]|uniref:Sugar kinase n=1 Tax=Streptomyces polyasparticus TaxID=2767826 RepID=A0ABR7SBE1_9ACTN|nr:sugar kinase [Streptomyces polyasparticus]MBC9712807.1 sugar kinase [Streptomyces polyasparticus]
MPSVPRQSTPPDEPPRQPEEDRRHMIRRRWITAIIIVLLIGVPAGYLAISAGQSRDSGRDKEKKYSATGLTAGWPSRVQRRIYEVPIPTGSTKVAYYETNNWRTSRLYVQFETSPAGLDGFLKGIGETTADLQEGEITISKRDQSVVGWEFTGPGPWSGLTHKQKDPRPTQTVTVNTANPARPMVYVVSTATP